MNNHNIQHLVPQIADRSMHRIGHKNPDLRSGSHPYIPSDMELSQIQGSHDTLSIFSPYHIMPDSLHH